MLDPKTACNKNKIHNANTSEGRACNAYSAETLISTPPYGCAAPGEGEYYVRGQLGAEKSVGDISRLRGATSVVMKTKRQWSWSYGWHSLSNGAGVAA